MSTHGTAITPEWYQLESIQMCVISAQLSKQRAPPAPPRISCANYNPSSKKVGMEQQRLEE